MFTFCSGEDSMKRKNKFFCVLYTLLVWMNKRRYGITTIGYIYIYNGNDIILKITTDSTESNNRKNINNKKRQKKKYMIFFRAKDFVGYENNE